MTSVRLACAAMATRFEFVLHGTDEVRLRAAGEEALDEVRRIESALSLYRPDSQVSAINREAALRPVRVTPEVYRLLEHALLLSRSTGGAFDLTVAPLMRIWGLMRGTGRLPTDEEIAAALACVGADRVLLDASTHSVAFDRPGVMIDFGAIGKGYALDRAAELLREVEVTDALLHGGTSTAIAFGRPPDQDAWRIAIDPPPGGGDEAPAKPLAVVELKEASLSVSAVWGKGFEVGGRFQGHVMDPRSGRPVQGAWLAAMLLPSATESDALSTALLVRGAEMVETMRSAPVAMGCLVVEPSGEGTGYRVVTHGIPLA